MTLQEKYETTFIGNMNPMFSHVGQFILSDERQNVSAKPPTKVTNIEIKGNKVNMQPK